MPILPFFVFLKRNVLASGEITILSSNDLNRKGSRIIVSYSTLFKTNSINILNLTSNLTICLHCNYIHSHHATVSKFYDLPNGLMLFCYVLLYRIKSLLLHCRLVSNDLRHALNQIRSMCILICLVNLNCVGLFHLF